MSTNLYLLITVDVENPQTPLFEGKCQKNTIWNKKKSSSGLLQILKMITRLNFKATFFVNVFEESVWGKDVMINICKEISVAGGDVQLHVHPLWRYNKSKEHLWQYSLNEQIGIIKDGKELLKEWTGEYPVVHRAGAYGLNEDTLKSLRANDIPIDSSMFYSHPNCKVTWTKNKVVEKKGIIEIPVTGFHRNVCWKAGPVSFKKSRHFIKTDIDWASLDELKYFVHEAKTHDIRVMNLFMHSYSLVKFDQNFSNSDPDWDDINKLDEFLSFVSCDPQIKVITIREFYEMYQQNPEQFIGSDYVPQIEKPVSFRSIHRKIYRKALAKLKS